MKLHHKTLWVFLLLALFATASKGSAGYQVARVKPIDYSPIIERNGRYINHNYGEYRGGATYMYHDGIDYYARSSEIYPVSSGTAHVYPNNGGWGNCVIVNHGAFQTRYAHLSSIIVTDGLPVNTNTVLGISGNTGASEGEHLHFSIGDNVSPANTINPILAGLKQSQYGYLKIKPCPKGFNIRLLATGSDQTFGGENEVILSDSNETVNIPKPGQLLKAVVSAYHYTGRAYTTPYKIELEVEKIRGKNDFVKIKREIVFDSIANINKVAELPYCFSRPYVTSSKETEDYYAIKFMPTAGEYTITAKIYSCYRDDYGFHLSDPEIASRDITVGLNRADLDFWDPTMAVCWLPDDIAGRGIMLASVPTPVGAASVRASGVTLPVLPEVFYAYANNNIITSNLIDVDPNLQQKVLIEARVTPEADWLIEIRNKSGGPPERIAVSKCDWLRTEWGAGKPAGEYTFTVTATNAAGVTTYESYDTITIDNNKPSALVYTISNSVSTTEQTISTKIRPYENLRSMLVNVVKDGDYSMAEERIYSTPFAEKDKEEQVDWEDAIAYPEGFYRLQYVMTDVAGNIDKAYSPVVSVNTSGSFIPPAATIEVSEPTLPEMPKWEDRPKVSNIAFDGLGNIYVLSGRYNKLVKYDPVGNMLKTITGVGTSEYRCPLGLAVSPSGDRIYVADTYANRVLIYDGGLNPVKEIKGPDVYVTYGKIDTYSWFCGLTSSQSNNAGAGINKYSNEHFNLPDGISLYGDNLYVTEKNGHRLLKYDKGGEASIFSILKADLRDEARAAFNRTEYVLGVPVSGRTVDKALIYSSALNDKIVFNRRAIDTSDYDSGWTSEMFYHYSSSGSGDGQFASPADAVVGPSSSLYIADTGNNRIQKFNADGSFAAKFGEGILKSPKGIDIDSYGNIWVADAGNHRIVQLADDGTFIREYKSEEYEINPQKIKVKDGKIYIADADHDKPLVWNIGGSLANVRVTNPWISPNSDSVKDTTLVQYTLSQPAEMSAQLIPKASSGATAQSTGNLLAFGNLSRGIGFNEESWGGQVAGNQLTAVGVGTGESQSNTITDGSYTLKLIASFGDYRKSSSVDLNIDTTPPVLTLDRAPPAISPNSDSVKDTMTINYSISDNLSPTAEVKLTLWKNNRLAGIRLDEPKTISATSTAYSLTWDGKVGGYLVEGRYILQLAATDLAGNTQTATSEVLVDNQPPQIEAVKLSNPYFSPNGDGRKDNTEISFVLSDNYATTMPTTVLIENSQGAEIARLANRLDLSPGEHCFTWEGASLPDTSYAIRVYTEDDAGNLGTMEPLAVAIDTVPPTIESFAADPNPFTPNDDGVKDRTVFSYKLSEPCNTELKIFREDQSTLFRDHRQSDITSGSFKWDGTGFHGEIMGEDHPFNLYAEDRAGNVTTSESKTIVVDHAPSLVPYAFAEPDPFSPVNPKNNTTTIRYFLTRDGLTVNAAITGQEGRVVKQLVKDAVQNKGEHTVSWDGSFDPTYDGPCASGNSSRVADGAWELKVTTTASDEPKPCLTSNTVLVDNVPPFILTDPVAVDLVSRQATLTYSVPERSTVEVAVYDQGHSLVKALSNTVKTAGTYTAVWQATAADKDQAYFKVTAIDRALNETEKKSELFAVVPQENLQITGLNAIPATFTPNGDGLLDQTRFAYRLSGGAPEYTVNIMVQTQTGSTVKTIVRNDPQNTGTYSFYWDGKNDAGIVAPDGHYRCVIEAVDKLAASIKGESAIFLVATKPTVSLTVSLPIFSPNGDGAKDTVDFNYSVNYATMYLSGEALVKIEVLNGSSEAVWSKIFNKNAGSYVFQYDGTMNNGASLPTGDYYVRISGQDILNGTAIQQTVPLTVDYSVPEPTDFAVSHAYAKFEDEVTVGLTFPEPLAEDPTVSLNLSDGAVKNALLTTKEASNYTYSYTIAGEDAEGATTISVEARDLAFNPILRTKTVVIDKTEPVVSGLAVTPNPASTPEAVIRFNVSEPLNALPVVYVTQQGAAPVMAIGAKTSANSYEYKHDVYTGYDGPALITIEVFDLANNESRFTNHESLLIDTIAPVFTGLECGIGSNPEHNKFAKEDAEVVISFRSSETLKYNPEVRVNQETATFSRRLPELSGEAYEYIYAVTGAETNGTAEVTIAGSDFADNAGGKTSVSSESFVIDLIRPLVAIASPESEMIATPSPFQTNGKPGTDSLQTRLNYEINEPGYVTISVHKVTNNQETYARTDFTADNQVAKFTKGWENGGAHFAYWDGRIGYNQAEYDKNSNGFADPGKYAFIVDVRDRAGNLIEGKMGGTCWIQDNVLDLAKAERGADNPSPLYFSPNGDGTMETTTAYFRVALGITPAECKRPERISVFGVQDIAWSTVEGKAIGTYTARVYNSDKSQLIKTICENEELQSYKVRPVVWDGRNTVGSYVAEGTYLIEIDARDYLGGQAMNNLLTLTATVDTTAPVIVSHEPQTSAATNWHNGKNSIGNPITYTYDVDYSDNGNAFASKLARAEYKVRKPSGQETAWQLIFNDLNNGSYADNWENGVYAFCDEGVNTVSVRAIDKAGNETAATFAFYVRKDETRPTNLSASINAGAVYTTSRSVNLQLGAEDPLSGVSETWVANDGEGFQSFSGNPWSLRDAEGGRTVTAKFKDVAGNWSNTISDDITLDRVGPSVTALTVNRNPMSPVVSTALTFSYSLSEGANVTLCLDGSAVSGPTSQIPGGQSISYNVSSGISEGSHSYYLHTVDLAGNSADSGTNSFTVDKTAPTISNISFSRKAIIPDGVNTSANIYCTVSDGTVSAVIQNQSGTPVKNKGGFVGSFNWDARNDVDTLVPVGYYYVNFTATDSAGNTRSTFSPRLRVKSRDEIIMVDDNGGNYEDIRVAKIGKNAWSFATTYWPTSNQYYGYSALGDYLGNGRPLFAVLNGNPAVNIFDPRTHGVAYSFAVPTVSALAACDYNGDGTDEIATMGNDGWVRIYNRSGSLLKSFKAVGNEIAAGDFDGDGDDEIVTIYYGSQTIYLFDPSSIANGSASINYYRSWSASAWFATLACGDFNGDGKDEIATVWPYQDFLGDPWDNYVYIYDHSGALISHFNFRDAHEQYPYIGASDVNGDGIYEVVLGQGGGGEWMGIFNALTGQQLALDGLDGGHGCNRPTGEDVDCVYDFTSSYSVVSGPAAKSATLELPTLIAPNDKNNSAYKDVQNIRPIFEWSHHKGNTTEYRIDVAKNDSFSIANQSFTKSPNTGSPDGKDPTLFNYSYAIHEFDPGLEKETYFWKVTALTTNEAATSEVWSFKISPDLTLTDITNYPNPFSPNREKTKIRYKLGSDVDEVKIRIYDITGRLVTELDGTTNGELSSIWSKYNDIGWDGRNGRGDMVMNGIYPYEVMVRLGDKSLSGRGKIAVLK